jgi:hypothetical protein
VIVHLPLGAEGRALAEFERLPRPGGWLALRVAGMDALRSRHSESAHERQRFTRGRLRRTVEAAGFTLEGVTYLNTPLLPVAFFIFRVWEPLTRAPAASDSNP